MTNLRLILFLFTQETGNISTILCLVSLARRQDSVRHLTEISLVDSWSRIRC